MSDNINKAGNILTKLSNKDLLEKIYGESLPIDNGREGYRVDFQEKLTRANIIPMLLCQKFVMPRSLQTENKHLSVEECKKLFFDRFIGFRMQLNIRIISYLEDNGHDRIKKSNKGLNVVWSSLIFSNIKEPRDGSAWELNGKLNLFWDE